MGRSTTPNFVVEYQDQRGLQTVIWNTKTNGHPTLKNLEKWRKAMNDSFKAGGVNAHVSLAMGFVLHVSNCQIRSQKDGGLRCTFKAPLFEVM